MSAQQVFAYCFDCKELGYGIADSNGVYTRDSGSSNHWDHSVHTFRRPAEYSPPIRLALSHLHGQLPLSDTHVALLKIALWRGEILPNGSGDKGIPDEHTEPTVATEQWDAVISDMESLLVRPGVSPVSCWVCSREHHPGFDHCSTCGLASRYVRDAECLNHRGQEYPENLFDLLEEVNQ